MSSGSSSWVRRSTRGFQNFELIPHEFLPDFDKKDNAGVGDSVKIGSLQNEDYTEILPGPENARKNSEAKDNCSRVQSGGHGNDAKSPKKDGSPKNVSSKFSKCKEKLDALNEPVEETSAHVNAATCHQSSDGAAVNPKKRGRPRKSSLKLPADDVKKRNSNNASVDITVESKNCKETDVTENARKRNNEKTPQNLDLHKSKISKVETPKIDSAEKFQYLPEIESRHEISLGEPKVTSVKKRGRPKKTSICPGSSSNTSSAGLVLNSFQTEIKETDLNNELKPREELVSQDAASNVASSEMGQLQSCSSPKKSLIDISQDEGIQTHVKKRGRPRKVPSCQDVIRNTQSPKSSHLTELSISIDNSKEVPMELNSVQKESSLSQSISFSFKGELIDNAHSISIITSKEEKEINAERKLTLVAGSLEGIKKVVKKKGRPRKVFGNQDVIPREDSIERKKSPASTHFSTGAQEIPSEARKQTTIKKRGRPKKFSISQETEEAPKCVSAIKDLSALEKPRRKNESVSSSSSTGSNASLNFNDADLKKRGRPKKKSMSQDISLNESLISDCYSPICSSPIAFKFESSKDGGREESGKKKGRPKKISINENVSNDEKLVGNNHSPSFSSLIFSSSAEECSLDKGNLAVIKKRGRPKKVSSNQDSFFNKKSTDNLQSPSSSSSPIDKRIDFSFNAGKQAGVKKRGRPKKISLCEGSSLGKSVAGNPQSASFLSTSISPAKNASNKEESLGLKKKKKGNKDEISKILDGSPDMETIGFLTPFSCPSTELPNSSCIENPNFIKKKRKYIKKSSFKTDLDKEREKPKNTSISTEDKSVFKNAKSIKKKTSPKEKKTLHKKDDLEEIANFDKSSSDEFQLANTKGKHGESSLTSLDQENGGISFHIDKVAILKSVERFANNLISCPSPACGKDFKTFFGLFKHSTDHELYDERGNSVWLSLNLPCPACKQSIGFGFMFLKHMRRCHKDVVDLAQAYEAGKIPRCFNYTCNSEVKTYEDCIKHGCECGSLIKCEKCERIYKTRHYMKSHTCVSKTEVTSAEKEDKDKKLVNQLSEFITGPRKSAKRARNAITRLDLNEEESVKSKRKRQDKEFEAEANSSEDSAEFESDDDEDDDDGEENAAEESTSKKKGTKDIVLAATHHFTAVPKHVKCIAKTKIKPCKQSIKWLKEWYDTNHSDFLFPNWNVSTCNMVYLNESEAREYFPKRTISPEFNIVYETAKEHACKTDFTQLTVFQTMPALKGSSTSTIFVGGSVLGMDWCPMKGEVDQYLAISTTVNYSQSLANGGIPDTKHLVQIWKTSRNQTGGYDQMKFSMGICVDFGPVSCLKWCPSGSFEQNENSTIRRLGILALSGNDGLIRIISVPYPEDCVKDGANTNSDTNYGLYEAVFVKIDPVITLVTSRGDVQKGPGVNDVSCCQWQPSNGHRKFAAGFRDGRLCIWDLESKSSLLRIPSKDGESDFLLPFARISAHAGMITSLDWCPTDENFIMTVSFEKKLKIFDIRCRQSVPLISIKRAFLHNCLFMRRLACITITEDEVFSSFPTGSRCIDIIQNTRQRSPYSFNDLITTHAAGCKGISFSDWINGYATACDAGEVVFRACAEQKSSKVKNSTRLPVYCVQLAGFSNNEPEKKKVETDSESEKSTQNDIPSISSLSAKDEIRKQAVKLEDGILKRKFTFRDTNFFEFRNKPKKCSADVNRVRFTRDMPMSEIENLELRQVNKLQWNPNYGSHHLLASGGVLGLVRVHHFSKWK